MKKNISLLVSACILSTSLLAANNKNIYINVDSDTGSEILKSELEYKNFLIKKAEITALEKKRIAQTQKNCEDIKLLKKAVAKLILESQKNKFKKDVYKEEKNNTNPINKKELTKNIFNVKTLKKINLPNEIEESKNIKDKKICTNKTKLIVDKSKIHESYYKQKDTKYRVSRQKSYIYEYPVLGEKSIGVIKHNETFIGDMYTAAGWVHAKNKGWVKGYLLSPKVLYDKTKIFNKNNSAFIKKTIKECK
jgi:hypothetical protein